jgi:hypothetical protein
VTTANPQIDVTHSKEAGELFGQTMGFKNKVIGQANSPHRPSLRHHRARPILHFCRLRDALWRRERGGL